MARTGLCTLLVLAALLAGGLFPSTHADPVSPQEPGINNDLQVQIALAQGEKYLMEREPAKAVLVLEATLPRIDGNLKYLMRLRDAYRAHVKELCAANQHDLARKYLERLSIIDRQAASDLAAQVVPASAAKPGAVGGNSSVADSPMKKAAGPEGAGNPKPAVTARAQDPFDFANLKITEPGPSGTRTKTAQALLDQADMKFREGYYAEALELYEQAHQQDAATTLQRRDFWAYCKMEKILNQLNQQGPANLPLSELEQQVHAAMALAPGNPKLASFSKVLLTRINQQREQGAKTGGQNLGAQPVAVQHPPSNVKGWQLAETSYFRIFHNQSKNYAEKVAQIAEQTRLAMSRKWFGHDGERWACKCDVFVYASAQDYSSATGARPETPGHSRIEADRGTGRIVSRRIHLHATSPRMLESDLPHETTHVVLADLFGHHPVPCWADEGMAVLSEPNERQEHFRRDLARFAGANKLFNLRQLMQMTSYPDRHRLEAFYAQSVSLVEFLTRERGPQTLTAFLRDGLQGGYEASMQKHYGYRNFEELQERWSSQALNTVTAGTGVR